MDLTDVPDVRGPDEEPPNFDDWEGPESLLKDRPIRERMLDVIVQLREPTKVAEVAERVDCDTETAREYLKWFARMGLVHEHDGRPTRYALNRSYYQWRRVEQIRATNSEAEIVEALQETLEAVAEYREQFDAEHPGAVSLMAIAEERGDDVEAIWEALVAWKTAQKRAELLDAARRESGTGSRASRIDA